MNNQRQNTIIAACVAVGIVLCVLLLAISSMEKKNNKKTGTGTKPQTQTQANVGQNQEPLEIVNMPTTQPEVIETTLAVIKTMDLDSKMITFYDVTGQLDRTFNMKVTPSIYTEYGNATSIDQIYPGQVVDITYEATKNVLQEIRLSNSVTRFRGVSGLTVNVGYRTMSFYNHLYGYSDSVIVAAGSLLLTPSQISDKDLVTVYSTDSKVLSVVIDRGHGYLSLTGVDLFMGGYVNVGSDIVRTIEKDMMIMVPEGEYKVSVAHSGYYASKTVMIAADTVSVVDFSEFAADAVETGNVFFNISVMGAKLFLNGEETDYSEGIITIPVGTYSVRVTADGYETYTDRITVTTDFQRVTVDMVSETATEESGESSTEATSASSSASGTSGSTSGSGSSSSNSGGSGSSGSSSSSSTSTTETETYVSSKNKVYIQGPTGALVYLDGSYKGIAPVNFAMVTGNHTILIVQGTTAKQYAVTLAEGPDDVVYDFTDK